MKQIFLISCLILFISCNSIRVITDHDSSIDFNKYTSFAYLKPQIDKIAISDLDKKRILRAVDGALALRGLSKSDTPDLLVSFSTKAKEKVYISNMGWNPWFWGPNQSSVSTQTEGTLFINFIDASSKQLVWQGKGRGAISEFTKNRDERIGLFVQEILRQYPPRIDQ